MKRSVIFSWILLMIVSLLVGSCKPKKTSTLPETKPEPKPDTSFIETKPVEIDTSDDAVFSEADLSAELEREVQEKLKPVYFEFNSFTLTPEAIDRLGIVASFLSEHPNLRVLIEGHCDERGSSEYNMGLGESRARVVKKYLLNYGMPSLQVEITSWGKEQPIMHNCVDEGCHSQNRRAEFKVLAK
ncbi:MAG: OmpA family protein [Chitinivibrionales bacterium]|nr:OmpA family protein [Chitinivibrionales bacterium]